MKIKIILTAALCASLLVGCGGLPDPTQEMTVHCQNAYPGMTVTGVQCMSMDTDGDGYISCSATILDKNGAIFTRERAACSSSVMQSGCK